MNQITANFLVESVNIALYVIGGIAALVIIYFILDRLVFVVRKNRKQVEELRKNMNAFIRFKRRNSPI